MGTGRLIWAPAAVDDVEAIAAYIAKDSRRYAAAMVRRIRVAAQRLPSFPRMGRRVPELDDDSVREVIVRPYRVIYRIGGDDIAIVAVVHGVRDLPSAIGERDV